MIFFKKTRNAQLKRKNLAIADYILKTTWCQLMRRCCKKKICMYVRVCYSWQSKISFTLFVCFSVHYKRHSRNEDFKGSKPQKKFRAEWHQILNFKTYLFLCMAQSTLSLHHYFLKNMVRKVDFDWNNKQKKYIAGSFQLEF